MHIGVIGLGYVGLPLAVGFAKFMRVSGYDIRRDRIDQLKSGRDSTGEVNGPELRASSAHFTSDYSDLMGCDVFIITVPTPLTEDQLPDLSCIQDAAKMIGEIIQPGAIVVLESTVYPGVTEEVLGGGLAHASGLVCGQDFFLGYSPERINPGDREHNLSSTTKVVAGQTPEVTKTLMELYGEVTGGYVYESPSIEVAEAAKVIENAQRDINISFINEVAIILNRRGISIYDVLDAASTKWNFLNFKPGLVGGHCIGVDPHYLAHFAKNMQYLPELILAGRRINDSMGRHIGDLIAREVNERWPSHSARILVLGITFKEDVPDLRNTKVVDLVRRLQEHGHHIDVHDPVACPIEAKQQLGIDLIGSLDDGNVYDVAISAVAHRVYQDNSVEALTTLIKKGGILADVKGIWRRMTMPDGVTHWVM